MTMEQSNKSKPKKSISRYLLPNKIPNKVGVAVIRSQSARESGPQHHNLHNNNTVAESPSKGSMAISKRPLSLNVKNMSPSAEKPTMKYLQLSSPLGRCSSVSENNVSAADDNLCLIDESKLTEKSRSFESVMKEAQVLYLIPTAQARQRNFLQGKIGANSLLGPNELSRVFPGREVTIFVGTWNMNGHTPPKELNDFVLPIGVEHVPDILVFGTQESCSERFEWEVCLQETLGPSHLLYHSVSLGTLHLVVFLRRDLIWYISTPEEASLSVRPGTTFRTKGAVASSFTLFGTSFLFVTAHLTAHQEKVKERVSDVRRIVNALDLPKLLPCKNKCKDVTQNFDYIFWSGDLNFRLSTPRAKVLEWLSRTSFPLPPHLPHGYLHHDQLCSVLADGAAFKGFSEAQITFPPTYKYDPGTQNFDSSSKQRTPAYTDRILFKQRSARRFSGQPETPPLKCLVYDSVSSITSSDHKPVWGVFKANLRPGLDTIPLAAGLFHRDVYLEGLKRRAATLNDSKSGTAVCSIQ